MIRLEALKSVDEESGSACAGAEGSCIHLMGGHGSRAGQVTSMDGAQLMPRLRVAAARPTTASMLVARSLRCLGEPSKPEIF